MISFRDLLDFDSCLRFRFHLFLFLYFFTFGFVCEVGMFSYPLLSLWFSLLWLFWECFYNSFCFCVFVFVSCSVCFLTLARCFFFPLFWSGSGSSARLTTRLRFPCVFRHIATLQFPFFVCVFSFFFLSVISVFVCVWFCFERCALWVSISLIVCLVCVKQLLRQTFGTHPSLLLPCCLARSAYVDCCLLFALRPALTFSSTSFAESSETNPHSHSHPPFYLQSDSNWRLYSHWHW